MDTSDRVVVIGAGMGGLAAAIRLAAAGHEVDILEAAAAPGGKMRTLPSDAGPVDAGPTVLTMRHVFDDLFAAAGARLDDRVTLARAPLLARHFWTDAPPLDLYDDPERSAEAIGAWGGAQAAAEFRRFAARARRLYEGLDAPMMRAPRPSLLALTAAILRRPRLLADIGTGSLADALARSFTEPRLRQLFGRYATYVGGLPTHAPGVLALIWHAEASGVWRVRGGMHRLAGAMAGLATDLGARLHTGTRADWIETDRGRVVAVHTSDGATLPTRQVVFNGDPRALAMGLMGPGVSHAVPRAAVEPRALSAHVLAFAATPTGPEAAPLAYHNVFFADDPRAEFGPLAAGAMPTDPTIYVCAEDRGDGPPAPGTPERFETIMNAPPAAFAAGAAPQTDEEIATCLTRTLTRLDRSGLTFAPPPGRAQLTTQEGFRALFPGSAGSLYGRSPHGTWAAFARPTAQTRVTGLVLAGGGAHPGAGIPMATLSGAHAAAAIMRGRTSISRCRPTATPGGISTGSPTTAPARSPSSPSSAPSSRPGTAGRGGGTRPTTAA